MMHGESHIMILYPRILKSTWTLRSYSGYHRFAALACSVLLLPSCMTLMEGSMDHKILPVFQLQRRMHAQGQANHSPLTAIKCSKGSPEPQVVSIGIL